MTREIKRDDVVITAKDIGIMGTGANFFRTGLAHSSGKVYIGTYGPQPAILWEYDPATGELLKIGTPGEYQLDSMVESPDGRIFIGTAYEGLVYAFDPISRKIENLGSPPVDSTPWIFSMICTGRGEIFGAKGVGLFKLDWKTGHMQSCGIVPGEHMTPAPNSSNPIVRYLEERPDGLIWGDTNRWIFSFNPDTFEIIPLADMAAYDDACYALFHHNGQSPVNDMYFQIYSRFSGRIPRREFMCVNSENMSVEPFPLDGPEGLNWLNGWWKGDKWYLLLSNTDHYRRKPSRMAVVDPGKRTVVEYWKVEDTGANLSRLAGPGLWFISTDRGLLHRAVPEEKRVVVEAVNPEPVMCRCLAASPEGMLGTDTYDSGVMFSYELKTGRFTDHGKVYPDDHRCNCGPAAFAGKDGRYFLANHGQAMPLLWVTDMKTDMHWKVGESAIQLTAFKDGTVWGTSGPNPETIVYRNGRYYDDYSIGWLPAWSCKPGRLFRYNPGDRRVIVFEDIVVGPVAEVCGIDNYLLAACGNELKLMNIEGMRVEASYRMQAEIKAMAAGYRSQAVYMVLENGEIYRYEPGKYKPERNWKDTLPVFCAEGFGSIDKGFFELPVSGCMAGIAPDGKVNIFDPDTGLIHKKKGPVPLPAGPAVDPAEDAWYFAEKSVVKYTLDSI